MNDQRRITQEEIARKLGIDKSTVSLALRDSPRLRQETRKKVRELAEALGYRPDPAIAILARQRWEKREPGRARGTLHYLVQKKKGEIRLQRRHFAMAKQRAYERGYDLVEFDLSTYPSGAAASKVLFHRGSRGLILPALPLDVDPDLRDFQWENFTVVGCSVGWLRTAFHLVMPDQFEGTRRAWQEAVRRGYRRIGGALFRHNPVAIDDFTRVGASYAEQTELVPARERVPFLLSEPTDREAFLAWFEKHRPDAVISLVSQEPYRWLKEAGYRVPEDVGFVSLHVRPDEPFSGVSVQFEEVARAAVDFLIAQMLDNNWGVPATQQILLLEPKWREGETLPARAVGV